MYDFPIASSSPSFDMLVKLPLEFLFNLLFGPISPLLYSQCAQCLSFLSKKMPLWIHPLIFDSKVSF